MDLICRKSSQLNAAYPNPFNPTTELSFDLPKSGQVTLRIFDVLGRESSRAAE